MEALVRDKGAVSAADLDDDLNGYFMRDKDQGAKHLDQSAMYTTEAPSAAPLLTTNPTYPTSSTKLIQQGITCWTVGNLTQLLQTYCSILGRTLDDYKPHTGGTFPTDHWAPHQN
ncbi:hypothetical protein HaLaN_12135 [Haematococcus lacustris]|uniref:Uncharacterized protein n=1 Tax=Haematococcus lacustris TaxID=44745 RepID=A0A699Z9M5_HAELA|nr:hypothetical protein HaLaN_12135 [Haematococcus lacustris]